MSDAQTNPPEKPPVNPSNEVRRRPPRRSLVGQHRRLEVPELPGWHLHWFKEENVPLALDAYYEHVDKGEVELNQQNVALDQSSDGGTDMGSRISIVTNQSDRPIRAYLMKIKEEYWAEDQKLLEQRNVGIMQAIFGDEAQVGMGGVRQERDPLTYVDKSRTALYNRQARKAKIRRRGR